MVSGPCSRAPKKKAFGWFGCRQHHHHIRPPWRRKAYLGAQEDWGISVWPKDMTRLGGCFVGLNTHIFLGPWGSASAPVAGQNSGAQKILFGALPGRFWGPAGPQNPFLGAHAGLENPFQVLAKLLWRCFQDPTFRDLCWGPAEPQNSCLGPSGPKDKRFGEGLIWERFRDCFAGLG